MPFIAVERNVENVKELEKSVNFIASQYRFFSTRYTQHYPTTFETSRTAFIYVLHKMYNSVEK